MWFDECANAVFAKIDDLDKAILGNDPLYNQQWALPKIDAPEAWDTNTGSSDVIVAVVDTGVDYNHRDLANNMWTNASGHYGYDFYNDDTDPIDDHGHGTHCAGNISAQGNPGYSTAYLSNKLTIVLHCIATSHCLQNVIVA